MSPETPAEQRLSAETILRAPKVLLHDHLDGGLRPATVLELADSMGLRVHIGDVSTELLHSADEIMAATTAGGVTPITALDGVPIGEGDVGPWTAKIRDEYWALMDRPSPLIEPIAYN